MDTLRGVHCHDWRFDVIGAVDPERRDRKFGLMLPECINDGHLEIDVSNPTKYLVIGGWPTWTLRGSWSGYSLSPQFAEFSATGKAFDGAYAFEVPDELANAGHHKLWLCANFSAYDAIGQKRPNGAALFSVAFIPPL